MAYLGNNPDVFQSTINISRFNGTGACTEFTIPQDVDDAKAIEVLVNSVQQDPDNSYTVTGGLITFFEAPSVGTNNVIVLRRTGTIFTRTQIDASDILPNAVTTAAIANDSITTSKLVNDSVTAAKLADTTVTPGNYGGAEAVSTISVDAQGRVTFAANVAIDTGFNPFLLSGM